MWLFWLIFGTAGLCFVLDFINKVKNQKIKRKSRNLNFKYKEKQIEALENKIALDKIKTQQKQYINNQYDNQYTTKESLLTDYEKAFFQKLLKAVDNTKFLVQPQVNLASIIDKSILAKYRNELFRNLDFVIFNFNYKPLVAIELNDSTHKQKNRYARDLKVREILKTANLPLVTFYSTYPNEINYIQSRLSKFLY